MFLPTSAIPTTGFVAPEELKTIGENVFQLGYALIHNSLGALGLRNAFIVVGNMAVREAAECDGKLVTIVLDLDVAKIGMLGRKSDHDIVRTIERHWAISESCAQLREQAFSD